AFVAAVVAIVAYLALAPNRWPALAATALAGVVGVVSVAVLVHKSELLAGAMTDPVAIHQGHRAALLIGIACIVTALAWFGLAEAGRRLPEPHRRAGWAVTGLIILAAELGIIGLLLIAGAVVVAVVGAVRSALDLRSGDVAAATAAGVAFFAAAAYDWVWQLAGIGIVGVGLLGVALGARPSTRARDWERFGALRPLLALVAVAAIVPRAARPPPAFTSGT